MNTLGSKKEDEKRFYDSIKTRLSQNPKLPKIEFLDKDDISEFYSSVGHVISTSDFESFHLTLADGPSLGCAAHTLKWDGSESIYNELWLNNDVELMAKRVHELNLCNQTSYHAYQQIVHLYPQMQTEQILFQLSRQFLEVGQMHEYSSTFLETNQTGLFFSKTKPSLTMCGNLPNNFMQTPPHSCTSLVMKENTEHC